MFHTEDLKITPLGAGNEVGRSCIHISYKSFELLLDCGVHPAFTGICSLPFLDLVDLSKIDAIFITHFHLDHAGALPYLTEKTNFKGVVYMTHPTKAILRWLLNDYIRIINANSDIDFYTEDDLNNCYEKIVSIDYHQTVNLNNFRITALNAGHVLGAAMFLIENDIFKLLYTGDYSTEADRHLKGADTSWIQKYEGDPNYILDVLICESTYGVQCHLPREEREKRFTNIVTDIVTRGGKCLLPVFALGRAQELLLILEDFWDRNQRLQKIPIYYASALANRCLSVYQAYAHMMNLNIKKDAFSFKHIKNLKNIEDHLIKNACVIMASPGMLQSGLSRELFELFCEDSRNGTVIAGYCVQGTLAKEILNEPKEIISMTGNKLKLNMKVDYVSFSAHVDFAQNSSFIERCRPKTVMLVHGEANEMGRLKAAIEHLYHVETMKNGEIHSVQVRRESVAVGMGLKDGPFNGIVVSDASGISLLHENELKTTIIQKIRLPGMLQKIESFRTSQYTNMKEADHNKKEETSVHYEDMLNIGDNSDRKGIFQEQNTDHTYVSQKDTENNKQISAWNFNSVGAMENTLQGKPSQVITEQAPHQNTNDITNAHKPNTQAIREQASPRETEMPVETQLKDITDDKQPSKEDLMPTSDSQSTSHETETQSISEHTANSNNKRVKAVTNKHISIRNLIGDKSNNISIGNSISNKSNNISISNLIGDDSTSNKIKKKTISISNLINNLDNSSNNKMNHNSSDLSNKINFSSKDSLNSHEKTSNQSNKCEISESACNNPSITEDNGYKYMNKSHHGNDVSQKEVTQKLRQRDEISSENNISTFLSENIQEATYQSQTHTTMRVLAHDQNVNQIKVENTFNATPVFIKQLLLNQFPSIKIKGNTLFIQEIQVVFDDDIYLVYKSGYINDMLACTIIRLIENITTRENVQLCKISKKAAIVKILNNYYDVIESDDNVEIRKNDKIVVLNEKEIKGDPHLLEEVKKIIKKIVNIF